MNLNTCITYARTILGSLTTTELSDSDAISYANDAMNEFEMDLASERDDYFAEKSTLNSISSGQSVVQFPNDLLLVKLVEVNFFDPTDATKFVKASEFDASNTPMGGGMNWSWYLTNQPKSQPLVDLRGGWFEVAPKADATYANAINLIYLAKFVLYDVNGNALTDNRFANTTDLLPYPLTMYPEILSYKIAELRTRSIGNVSTAVQKAELFQTKYKEKVLKLTESVQTNEQSLTSRSAQVLNNGRNQ